MKRTTISEIYKSPEFFADKEITVAGWAKTIRSSNAFGFIELGDGSFFSPLQIVFEADKLDNYKDIAKLRRYVSERGKIVPRRISGNCAKHQRQLTVAIKRARIIALLPFVAE